MGLSFRSICRSAEGRKRIISEIVQTLSPHYDCTSAPASVPPASALASIPFKQKPGFPPPYKVCPDLGSPTPVQTGCMVLWLRGRNCVTGQ